MTDCPAHLHPYLLLLSLVLRDSLLRLQHHAQGTGNRFGVPANPD